MKNAKKSADTESNGMGEIFNQTLDEYSCKLVGRVRARVHIVDDEETDRLVW